MDKELQKEREETQKRVRIDSQKVLDGQRLRDGKSGNVLTGQQTRSFYQKVW